MESTTQKINKLRTFLSITISPMASATAGTAVFSIFSGTHNFSQYLLTTLIYSYITAILFFLPLFALLNHKFGKSASRYIYSWTALFACTVPFAFYVIIQPIYMLSLYLSTMVAGHVYWWLRSTFDDSYNSAWWKSIITFTQVIILGSSAAISLSFGLFGIISLVIHPDSIFSNVFFMFLAVLLTSGAVGGYTFWTIAIYSRQRKSLSTT